MGGTCACVKTGKQGLLPAIGEVRFGNPSLGADPFSRLLLP